MIYTIKKNKSNQNMECVFIAEFTFDGENILIAMDEDCRFNISDIATILESGDSSIGDHPYVNIYYNGNKYGVQVIPEKLFIGKHPAGRVKFANNSKRGVATRTVFFDMPLRGCVTIYRSKTEKYTDSPNYTEECRKACIGFVYYSINDIEDYYLDRITFDEFRYRVECGYNLLRQSEKEKIAKTAFKMGSDKD